MSTFVDYNQKLVEYYLSEYEKSNCKYLVHGHSHRTKFGGNKINISVEQINYTPVLEENLKALIST